MSQFSLAFRKLHFMDGPAGDCIAFDFEIENVARRTATILSQEFELWLVTDATRDYAKRLAVLGSDIRGRMTETGAQIISRFGENQKSPMRLLWHYTPEQLQWIEEVRNGTDPVFQLRGLLTVQFVTIQIVGDTSKHIEYETPKGVGGWPYQIPISESTWLALLDRIGFKHIIFARLKWPILPPAFQNSQRNLDDAWKHFREGQTDSVLASCFKAFECLGFNLFADEKIQRKELIELLMQGAQPDKRETVHAILSTLQKFFHFGRHERGQKIDVDRNDAEMALVCATALLAYLGPYYVPAKKTVPIEL